MSQPSEHYSANSQEQPIRGTEVFVGGLPRTFSEDKIRQVFSSCGEIVEIRLIKDPKGNLKQFCFVRFATKEAAGKAIKEKAGTTLDGKKIGVLPSTQQDTLYFGSLNKAWGADEFEQIVHQVFSDVEAVDLIMLKDVQPGQKQRNRGFAFVKFSSHAAASRAQRVGSQPDFRLGNLHPAVKWAEEELEPDPKELDEIKIAFVRNLPADADENFLQRLFEPFGKVEKTVISRKGSFPVGFVHFTERLALDRSINELNEKTVHGLCGGSLHKLQVEVARPMDKNKKRAHHISESNPAIQGQSKSLKNEPSSIPSYSRSSDVQRQELQSTDPYEEAVISLPLAVKERLLRILRLGIATRFDLDVKNLWSLRELPEHISISVLDQFMLSGSAATNKNIYLAGLISRHLVDNVGPRHSLASLSRAVDNAAKESEQFSISPRVSPPTVVSLARHAHPTLARSDIYAMHNNTLPISGCPLSSRTLITRGEEKSPNFHIPNGSLYLPRERVDVRSSDLHNISNQTLFGHLHQNTHQLLQRRDRLEMNGSDYLVSNQQPVAGRHQNIQDYLISNQPVPGHHHQSMQLPGIRRIEEKESDFLLSNMAALSRHQNLQIPAVVERIEDKNRSPLEATAGSSMSHGRFGLRIEEQHFSPAEAVSSPSTSYPRQGMGSVSDVTAVSDRQSTRPQMRFDPFTGQPYKFDPFTGEPIRPE